MTFIGEVCDSADLAGMEKLISELSKESVPNSSDLHNCEWTKWERLSRELFNAPTDSEDMTFLFERLRSVDEFEHLSLDEFYNIAHDFSLTCVREPRTLIYAKQMQYNDYWDTDHINDNSSLHHSSLCKENSSVGVDSQVDNSDDASEQTSVFSSELFTDYAIVILVMGDAVLSFHSGSQIKSFILPSMTTIVSTHLHQCYPESTQILSVSPCWLLTLQSNKRERLRSVLVNIEQTQINAQMQFLRHSLHIKLFDCFSKEDNDDEDGDDNSNMNGNESNLLECATRLLPLHLSVNQTLYSEAEEANFLYLIKEGSVTLSRQVEKQVRHINSTVPPNKLKMYNEVVTSTEEHDLVNKKQQELFTHKDKTKAQSCNVNEVVQCVEVARLTCGDVCGEIALTGCDIDFRPAIDIVWTNSYWRQRLENDSSLPETITSSHSIDDRDHLQVDAETIRETTIKATPENNQTLRRYVMTAIATSPTRVYALSYTNCARFLPSVSLRRLCEYVKGYPSYDDLFTINAQQREWTTFRHNVSYNIEKAAREKAHYDASRFPPMTFEQEV